MSIFWVSDNSKQVGTLKSLIEEHARLDFFPPCSQIFSLLAYKIQEIFLVSSFIPSCLFNRILPCFFTIFHFDHNFAIKSWVILCFVHSTHLIQSDFPPFFNMIISTLFNNHDQVSKKVLPCLFILACMITNF